MVREFVEFDEGKGSVDAEPCAKGDEVVGGNAVIDALVCGFAGDSGVGPNLGIRKGHIGT